MKKELKARLIKKNSGYQERLEYLIRDINMIEQDILHIEQDIARLDDEFSTIKSMLKSSDKKGILRPADNDEDSL